VVEKQLPAALEEVEQRCLAGRAVEDEDMDDPNPRQPATLGGERVACPGGILLLDE
jgi:hypothetical protein